MAVQFGKLRHLVFNVGSKGAADFEASDGARVLHRRNRSHQTQEQQHNAYALTEVFDDDSQQRVIWRARPSFVDEDIIVV
jgi:hypothetical protein